MFSVCLQEREPTSLEILKGAYGIEVSKREEKLLVKGKGDMQTYLLSQRDGDISVPDGCTHTLRSPPVQFSKKIPVQRERGAGQGRRDESSSPVYWATR
jgi:hypothetical protein